LKLYTFSSIHPTDDINAALREIPAEAVRDVRVEVAAGEYIDRYTLIVVYEAEDSERKKPSALRQLLTELFRLDGYEPIWRRKEKAE
jgi:hypothetical protein